MKTYKEKNYDISWERGKEKLEAKGTGEGAQWARENYINAKKLKDAIDLSKDIKRPFAMAIATYKRDNPDKIGYIFREAQPTVHGKIEDNIMQSITEGFIGNIVQKAGRNYKTCFPEVQSIADVDRDSLFKYVSVKPSTCLFGNFISIFGRKKFQTFSKVPLKVIENLQDKKREIKECGKSAKENINKAHQGQKSKKWNKGKGQKGQKGQKGKKSKGKWKGQRSKKKK